MSDAGKLAVLTGQIRRSLSMEGMRSQARCLLSRLEQELQRGGEDGEGEKSVLPQPQSGQAFSEEGRVPPSLI